MLGSAAGNTTLIYVSHYREELPGCVNKVFRLENGRQVSEVHSQGR